MTGLPSDRPDAPARPRKRRGVLRRTWRRIRKPLARSTALKHGLAWMLARLARFIYATNPLVPGSDDPHRMFPANGTVIYAVWHGQHIVLPTALPRAFSIAFMSSRSADSEIGALLAEYLGVRTVRGSGARNRADAPKKGGARALIAMKKLLDEGVPVGMTAEIPKETPREASRGIVVLARIARRPIVPVAYATSRRKVFQTSWDRTTLSLPFGRGAIVFGEPILVAPDADEPAMELKRREVTDKLNAATAKAYALADGRA